MSPTRPFACGELRAAVLVSRPDLRQRRLRYDPVSRLSTLTSDLAGTSFDLTKTFAYSPASQIASETRSNDNYAFVKTDATTSSTTNGLNELATVNGAAATYDANGNLTSDPSSGWSFGYDIENELTSAAGAGKSVTLSYDPLGALWKIGGSGIGDVGFVTDPTEGGEIAADYAPSTGALNHRYVFGPGIDEPIVEYDAAGNRTWLVADERGSIIARADSSGNAGQIDSYDEYGVPASTNAGRYQYTGQAALYEIGLDDYKARIYSPALGRFLQTDPIGYADDPNLYAYVHNDPVNLVDPSGLACPNGEVELGQPPVTTDPSGGIVITAPVCTPLSLFKSPNEVRPGSSFGPGIGSPEAPTTPTGPSEQQRQQQKPGYCTSGWYKAGEVANTFGEVFQETGVLFSVFGIPEAGVAFYGVGTAAKFAGEGFEEISGAPVPPMTALSLPMSLATNATPLGDYISGFVSEKVLGETAPAGCH